MKVLLINSVCGIGSTGRICTDLAQEFEKDGHEVKIAYGRDDNVPEQYRKYAIRIGNRMDVKCHALRTRILDEHGFGSKNATKKFLMWAEEYKPDLLWLHNIHGYYINIEMLFSWIKKHPDMEVKWTLHDCWAFTGHCAYFTMVDCNKWKSHCEDCPQKCKYPESKMKDNSFENFERKKEAFTGVRNMTFVTPSKWLADLVKQSYLSEYPVEVCYNKIDTNIFKPTPSDFREKYGLNDKKIILGVASSWDDRKGLGDFIQLSKMLDERYAIVLVGLNEKQIADMSSQIGGAKRRDSQSDLVTLYVSTNEDMDSSSSKEIVRTLKGEVVPLGVENLYRAITGLEVVTNKNFECMGVSKLVCMQRTNSSVQLAKIYSSADFFVNPTYEDNYPTVNLEAQACGAYVISYDIGGCRETLENFCIRESV